MDTFVTLLKYGFLFVLIVASVWIGWALVTLARDKAHPEPSETVTTQE